MMTKQHGTQNMSTWVRRDTTVNMMRHDVATFFKMNPKDLQVIMGGKIINTEGWRTVIGHFNVPALQQKGLGKIVVMPAALGGGKRARGGNTTGGESNFDKQDLLKEERDTIKQKLLSITNEAQFQDDDAVRLLTTKIITAMRLIDDNPQDCMSKFLSTASIDQLERLNMFTQTRNMEVLTSYMSKAIFFNECNEISLKLKVFKTLDDILAMVCKYAYKSCFMEDSGRISQMKFAALVCKTLVSSSAAAGAASVSAATGQP